MATMIPTLTEEHLENLDSSAEAKIYRALRDNLPSSIQVHFSVSWILKQQDADARDGEIDFVVIDPSIGFITVEVKGGGIGWNSDTDEWNSIDRYDNLHKIKDPAQQALKAKYSLLRKLKEHPKWGSLGIGHVTCGHSVFFPDIADIHHISKPDLPAEIVGLDAHLTDTQKWIDDVFEYWTNKERSGSPLSAAGLELFGNILGKSFEVRPLLAQTLADEEEQRIRLTSEQARILDLLRSQRRVSVSGGAGTGKTVLAVEKAKKLAAEGFRTLLTCYNNQLASHLNNVCDDVEHLEVMSFHQLCKRRVDEANSASGRDLLGEAKRTYPDKDLWDVRYPNALAYSIDILEDRYDAIVCDEGQDFGEDFWVPLELLLVDYEQSPFYIFFDENQDIYSRAASFPITTEPYYLTVNCRNTEIIHNACYRYYKGEPIDPPSIHGRDIEVIDAQSTDAQAKRLHARIVDLISNEQVRAGDIAVLIADGYHKSQYYESIRHLPLPGAASWIEEGPIQIEGVLMDTVRRFKGLEAPVVFLWGLDGIDLEKEHETLYVGMSRAKSLLALAGSQTSCTAILEHTAA